MGSLITKRRALLAFFERHARRAWVGPVLRALPFALPTAFLAWLAIRGILASTQGAPAVPLDDAYIHFQFARSFVNGAPLVYAPGAAAVAGATSWLWPAALAVGYALGFREQSIVWWAWALGFASLGLLAAEARRAARGLCEPGTAAGAAVLVFCFGANTWFAASGMEVVPLAWLMLRGVTSAAEWYERAPSSRGRRELVLSALLLPLLRPEGAWVTLLIALVLFVEPRGGRRGYGFVALSGVLLPGVLNRLFSGEFTSTTARSKWLLLSPYSTATSLRDALLDYAHTLLGTLLNGEIWSSVFLPRGGAVVALLALFALPLAGYRRGTTVRGCLFLALALGIVFPGTYDCPLCNRLRYLWPFFPAWLIGGAALADLLGVALARRAPEFRAAGPLAVGVIAGALLGCLHFALDDLATSAAAIYKQQVSLGKWAARALPRNACLGVNDTGAITYFSGKRTFDVVGLTTQGEARYWAAGAGARFEHYERLGRAKLPTHFIVYEEWFAIDALLGEELTERSVPGATILGGERMVAHVADYHLLGSAERPDPSTSEGRALLDRLDVADLESEASHGYALLTATQRQSYVAETLGQLDGARAGRCDDRFELEVMPGGALVIRVAADTATTLDVTIGGSARELPIPASFWHEVTLELPATLPAARAAISVHARHGTFSSLHYFSLGPRR
jgi:hypothetical protein